jgi:Ni/Fe-hydrogenase subunit HybB-like protein
MINRWQRGVQIYKFPLVSAPFVFFSTLAVIGISLSLGRLFTGLWFTGMNDDYAWGVWKTFNVMTLTALGSGGLAVGLFAWVFNKKKLHIVMRAALASSFLFYAAGMGALVIDVGRPWNMYNMALPWTWNLHSSLFEVALCMSAYVVLFLSFENLPPILDKLYINGDAKRRQTIDKWMPTIHKIYPFMVAGAYVLPAMHQSSLGSLMVIAGHKVHPLWQTQMLPAFYLIQAVICGFAAVIFILMSACLAWRRPLDVDVLGDMAKYMSWTTFVFIALRYVDLAIRGQLGAAFVMDRYGILFNVENLLVLVPAFLFMSQKLREVPRLLYVGSILVGLGGMLYRFTPTTIAYRANHPSTYFPKIAELIMCIGYIGFAVVVFIWMAKQFAIIPAPVSDWYQYVKFEKQQNPNLRINEHGAATDY